jgi:tetrahydromethanopterin S-methyltransferase subunit F
MYTRLRVCMFAGLDVYLFAGLQVSRFTGLHVYLFAGKHACRFTGLHAKMLFVEDLLLASFQEGG